jgi:hypothetical protein
MGRVAMIIDDKSAYKPMGRVAILDDNSAQKPVMKYPMINSLLHLPFEIYL